ncbi:hypothetical protein [Nostoc sp.]|uniref:hypothetical protein n=1 Tax=Nostoc sp. TaxID=1180 RepID=UPI002FFA451B
MEFFNGNIVIALLFYRHSSDRIHKNTTGDRTKRSVIAFLVTMERVIALQFLRSYDHRNCSSK